MKTEQTIWTIENNEVEQTTFGEYLSDNMLMVTHSSGLMPTYTIREIEPSSELYEQACERAGVELYDEDGYALPNPSGTVIYEVCRWTQFKRAPEIMLPTTDRN